MHPLDAASFVGRLAMGLAAGLLTWAGCASIGVAWLDRRLRSPDPTTRLAFGAALGFAFVGSVVALLGLFHAVRYGSYGVLAGLVVILATNVAGPARRAAAGVWRVHSFADRLAIGASGFALLTAVVAAALPAVWWDPIAYHLPIVGRALREGAFAFDPAMTQSAFPLLAEAAALPAFGIAGSAGAAFVSLGSGIALAALCGAVANRFEPRATWLAAALVATSPLWLWLAPSFYVDIPFAMFAVGALAAPLIFREAEGSRPWVALLCGLLAGAAAAVKSPGLVLAPVAAVVLACSDRERRANRLAWFGCAFGIVALPWYVRSFVASGDPVYPFLSQWTAHASNVREFALRYVTMSRNWCGAGYSLFDAALVPWRMLTQPRQYCGDPGYALRLGSVFFLAAVALVKPIRPIAAIAALLALIWFFESHQDRFVLPAMCFFAIVVAVGAASLSDRLSKGGTALLAGLGVVGVLANWLPALEGDASNSLVPAFAYISGKQSGDEYLGDRLESYAAARRLKGFRGKVLALDDVRDYYISQAVWANPYYQPMWKLDWTVTPAVRYAAAARAGVRYLIVNGNPAYVRRTPTGIDWPTLVSDERRGVLRLIFEHEQVSILELTRLR